MGHGHGPQNVREISIIDLNPGEHKYVKKQLIWIFWVVLPSIVSSEVSGHRGRLFRLRYHLGHVLRAQIRRACVRACAPSTFRAPACFTVHERPLRATSVHPDHVALGTR